MNKLKQVFEEVGIKTYEVKGRDIEFKYLNHKTNRYEYFIIECEIGGGYSIYTDRGVYKFCNEESVHKDLENFTKGLDSRFTGTVTMFKESLIKRMLRKLGEIDE